MSTHTDDRPDEQQLDHNEVLLRGRVSALPEWRQVPSGDNLAAWRLVVRRPGGSGSTGRASVDTIDCESFSKLVHRSVRRWQPGQMVQASGYLRRRFWQTPTGARSRYVVEVTSVRRLP